MNIELVDDQGFWLERISLDISPQKDEIEFLLESLTPIFFGGGEIRDANNVTDAQMFHFSGWAKRNKQLYQLYFHMTSEKIRKQLSAKRFLQNAELSMFFHGKTIPFKKKQNHGVAAQLPSQKKNGWNWNLCQEFHPEGRVGHNWALYGRGVMTVEGSRVVGP